MTSSLFLNCKTVSVGTYIPLQRQRDENSLTFAGIQSEQSIMIIWVTFEPNNIFETAMVVTEIGSILRTITMLSLSKWLIYSVHISNSLTTIHTHIFLPWWKQRKPMQFLSFLSKDFLELSKKKTIDGVKALQMPL